MSYSLLTFESKSGPRAGIAADGRVIDLATAAGNQAYSTILGVLNDWAVAEPTCSYLASKLREAKFADESIPLQEARLLAPVLPGSIFCAGANYQDHIEEMARVMKQPVGKNAKEQGDAPWHFVKTGRNAVVGPNEDVEIPAYSNRIDHEIELVAIIGRAARNVPIERALEHVAGYTIGNDLSAREVGRAIVPPGSPFHYDWITMKCFDGSCPIGPWIVPASQLPNPQNLALKLWVNGTLYQDSNTNQMIFSVAEQIAWLSSRLTLHPGDAILTGTPAGVGMPHARFLRPGDEVKLWIEGIGEMRNQMI